MKSLPKFSAALVGVAVVGLWLSLPEVRGQRLPGTEQKLRDNSASNSPAPQMADAPGPESAEAKAAFDQARQRLKSYPSIKAKLVETVASGNRRFTINGSYLQGGGVDLKLRMEFQVKLGETQGSILEVCDGQVLWTRHQIGGDVRISRRDVRQILQAAADNGQPDSLITVELGFGGLPGLLASVEKSIQFDQYRDDTAEGRKLVVIEGGWRPDMLKFWQGNKADEPLPDDVPARVRVYLDSESLFPRRILYLARNAEKILRPKVSLDFSEIETGADIPAAKFKFVPPDGIIPEDLTPQFLEQIKQRGQARK